jgi:hypothetical protein
MVLRLLIHSTSDYCGVCKNELPKLVGCELRGDLNNNAKNE